MNFWERGAPVLPVLGLLASLTQPAWAQSPGPPSGVTADAGGAAPGQFGVDPRRQPYGPGIEVQVIASNGQQVSVYVARATEAGGRPPDWAFVRVGRTPLAFELPSANQYWFEVESERTTRGSMLLRVGDQPRRLLVEPGDADLAGLASLFLAVGGLSALAATAILLSTTTGESRLNRGAVVIPLYAVGAGLLGGGVGLHLAASTDIADPLAERPLPVRARPARAAAGVQAGFTLRF